MQRNKTLLLTVIFTVFVWGNVVGQVRFNEIRSNDDGTDESEFVELIGVAGTDITGYKIYHVNGSGDSEIFTHTIGEFSIPDDGITDENSTALGFYVLGASGFSTGTDESTGSVLQNGPDGIVLYDSEGNVVDAVAWGGAGDISSDITQTGSPEADHYLHITQSDANDDNSLQAPDNVVGDDGSGWNYDTATIGAINNNQADGAIVLASSVKPEPADHATSFTATGFVGAVNLSWIDATGSPTPDAYLIKVSDTNFDSISDPTDTNPESNDSDLSDGSGTLNVNYGVESASFSGLDEMNTYYFKIFPYTNTGSDIDYKTEGTIPQDDATTLETPDIVLNEFLADPGGNDVNNDGNSDNTEDEFIEFVNTGSTDLDISGWTIEDATGTTYTFSTSSNLEPSQAIIVFGDGTPVGDFGGSIIQDADGSLSLNNAGDNIILKNNSGIEIINYSYNSSSSGISESRSPDLTGNFTSHTAASPDGSSFSPGTRVDGFAFHPRVKVTGNEGWRMLSTPTSDNSYDDLLNNIWTQCSTNANYNGNTCAPSGSDQPNVQVYDQSSGFTGVDDLGSTMTPGQGFIVYVYEDDDFDFGTNETFPKYLEMFGTENTGPVILDENSDFPLRSGSEEATLVGNPFLVPIDWDNVTKPDLSETVYVYDDAYGTIDGVPDEEAAGVTGSYRAWNGESGSLTDGLIAPFQGFWVVNSNGSPEPSLQINKNESVQGGTFYKNNEQEKIAIHLKAEMNNMFNEAFFTFGKNGRIGKDNFDGYEFTPLDHGNYISLSTEVEGTQMDINNLPDELYNPVEIPLHVQAFEAVESGWTQTAGEVTLTWPELQSIPPEWDITLTDIKLNKMINVKDEKFYVFRTEGSVEKINGKQPFGSFNPEPLQKEKAVDKARFFITINPNAPDDLIDNNVPNQFALEQNYPNPFNPSTSITFQIAEPSDVNLSIYNVVGQRISTLVNETKSPGSYEVTWDASEMASGIYYYRLQAGGLVFNRQMTLIK